MTNKRGFTLIEMLVTTIILVIVFGLLAVIFSRATVIHKVVRSGGDSENLGIYLINTIVYGHGINREEALIGSRPFSVTPTDYSSSTYTDTVLEFTDTNGRAVRYILTDGTLKHDPNNTYDPTKYFDLKPTWAKDRQLNVLTDRDAAKHPLYSEFSYYDTDMQRMTNPPLTTAQYPYYVGIKLVLMNTLQNTQEAVTLYQCVRIRNQIDF